MALPHDHRLTTMARIHPTYTPARILQLLDDRAAVLQRLIERADTLGELATSKPPPPRSASSDWS